jgi:hypothetical protein
MYNTFTVLFGLLSLKVEILSMLEVILQAGHPQHEK